MRSPRHKGETKMQDKENGVLRGRKMNLADYTFSRFGVQVPAGTTLEDVTKTTYFRNYTHQLVPGAEILVLSDDFELDVSLRVTSVSKTNVGVRVIRDSRMQPDASDLPAGFEVSWGGPKQKFRVLQDGAVLESGFGTKDEARSFAIKAT